MFLWSYGLHPFRLTGPMQPMKFPTVEDEKTRQLHVDYLSGRYEDTFILKLLSFWHKIS